MILLVWRLLVGWAAGGGICPSTSPTSTPMEWWDRRARSAKVQPHTVFNLFRNIWQSHTHLFPRCPSDLSSFWMQVHTQTKTHLLLHMHDCHQLCKYMHITLENDTLPLVHLPYCLSIIHTHTIAIISCCLTIWKFVKVYFCHMWHVRRRVKVWSCTGWCVCVCVFRASNTDTYTHNQSV